MLTKKRIFYNKDNIGNISLSRKFITSKDKFLLKSDFIKCFTLDYFLKKNKIIKIDVIKFDVEGHIFQILKKSSRLFKLRPILILEIDPKDPNLKKILYLLKKRNYKLQFYKKITTHDDYLFVHKDHPFSVIKIDKFPLLNTKKNNKFLKFKRIIKRIINLEFYALSWLNLRYDITLD
tara:strand:- start:147 stop:680 length:534 start_codon:yes stop_codon:yes gene_type:complete